jgi:hypothetical protein
MFQNTNLWLIEDSGPKVIKENIKNRFEERGEKGIFPYSEKRFQREEYGASKVEAQTPFELFCKEFKESSSKVPTSAEDEMKYFQNAWAELDENAKEVSLYTIPLYIFAKLHYSIKY